MNVCLTVTFTPSSLKKPGVSESMFLQRHEEDVLFRHYERRLLEFCNAFKPTMPKSVVVCMYACMRFLWTEPCDLEDICELRAFLSFCRVQPSCTSGDSTWATPSWSTTPGLSCKYCWSVKGKRTALRWHIKGSVCWGKFLIGLAVSL